ncbi:MAG: hypothetical protein NC299_16685 [Lachnospiraceae bacterium]|nr:hypothetical protein [Ruminococcus sp.]MCM1276973.1 hypothetical protein [Lachnospiraceae bacterium]
MNILNPNIEILSEYESNDTKVKCKCKVDGYEWEALARALLAGEGCKICGHKRVWETRGRKTTEILQREMCAVNENIKIVGEYKGAHIPIKCRCELHNCEWIANPSNLLNRNTNCPECAKTHMRDLEAMSNEEFLRRLEETNQNIEPLDCYVNAHTKLRFKCKVHNCIFVTTPRTFLYKSGRGCPYCSQSQGEKKMIKILEDKGFNIKQQKTFNDCRYIEMLRFDGYDIDNNIAYEYQGQQHYQPVDFAGKGLEWAKEQYEIIHKRDLVKVEYCKKNNIPLIEIPYWEFDNMEEFLNGEIAKYM